MIMTSILRQLQYADIALPRIDTMHPKPCDLIGVTCRPSATCTHQSGQAIPLDNAIVLVHNRLDAAISVASAYSDTSSPVFEAKFIYYEHTQTDYERRTISCFNICDSLSCRQYFLTPLESTTARAWVSYCIRCARYSFFLDSSRQYTLCISSLGFVYLKMKISPCFRHSTCYS